MSGHHSRFAPSSAHRVVECPASLLLNEQEPDSPSFEAVEGTVAHYIHEWCLIYGRRRGDGFTGMHPCQFMPEEELTPREWALIPYSRGLKPDEDFIITEEMIDYIEESVQRCREVPGEHYIEQRVDISPWCPKLDEHGKPMQKQTGTADFFACRPGHLDVRDLKYGIGVQVFAEHNYQAIKYALGVINEYDWLYDFETVDIWIHQPRLNHFDVWHTTKAELLKIGKYIKSRYEIALKPNAPFGASEKACQFCKVKPKCAHLADVVLSHFDLEEDMTKDDVKTEAAFLSPERQVAIFKMRGLYDLWIGSIQGDIERRLAADPKSVPGLKLVNGRSSRHWIDEDEACEELKFAGAKEEDLYSKPEFISPAQAEKLGPKLFKPIVSELAKKRLGKPVIVDADDPRPDYRDPDEAAADTHFETMDEFD